MFQREYRQRDGFALRIGERHVSCNAPLAVLFVVETAVFHVCDRRSHPVADDLEGAAGAVVAGEGQFLGQFLNVEHVPPLVDPQIEGAVEGPAVVAVGPRHEDQHVRVDQQLL